MVFVSVIPEDKHLIICFWSWKHLNTSGSGKITRRILVCAANTTSLLRAMAQITSKVFLEGKTKLCSFYPATFLPPSCLSPWGLWGAAWVSQASLLWDHTVCMCWHCSGHWSVRAPGWQQDEAVDTVNVTHETDLLVYEHAVKFHTWSDAETRWVERGHYRLLCL